MYVEALIGPDTVDTMPPQTIVAFRDHGKVSRTVDTGFGQAHSVIADLEKAEISMDAVTAQVLGEGVKSFADSFTQLAVGIEQKLDELSKGSQHRQSLLLFDQQTAADAAVEGLKQQNFVRRAWDHDPTAWTPSETAAKSIKDRLGWLDVTEHMIEQLPVITGLAEQVRLAGYTHAVVLGMGGSSLCPEVLRQTFGVRAGYPDLMVLDSTDPRENFIAITDPGTPLQRLSAERGFRKCFINPPDIGGRYSALSYFGMVPAAIMGADAAGLLDRAQRMEQCCVPVVPLEENAGAVLGAAMGALAQAGRNKVTFVCSPAIGSLGLWLEQLLAESTGKEGTGLIPIAAEPLGNPDVYGDDRLFVYLRLRQHADPDQDRWIEALEDGKQPQVRITLNDPLDLGQEFFRWEMATATAGSILRINPFDEPNVQESKDNTVRLLNEFDLYHKLPQPKPTVSGNGVAVVCDRDLGARSNGAGLTSALRSFLGEVRPGDYVALMAYIDPVDANEQVLQKLRSQIRDRLRVATTVGFGPRFLHSTGQLHKGGPDTGVFVQITGIDGSDQARVAPGSRSRCRCRPTGTRGRDGRGVGVTVWKLDSLASARWAAIWSSA